MEELKSSSIEHRKSIINNILKDEFFNKIHYIIKENYNEYIYEGDELIKYKLELNNKQHTKHIYDALKNYEQAINRIMAENSRYKDLYYDVISCKEIIEELCESEYINGTNNSSYQNYVFYDIIYCYYNTLNIINKYECDTEAEHEQSLYEAVKKILNNPHLCDDIKNDKKYKKYYNEFFNKKMI
jgi:hypothetical protein